MFRRGALITACILLISLVSSLVGYTTQGAIADKEESWKFDVSGKNTIQAELVNQTVNTESQIEVGLNSENLDLDLKVLREYQGGDEADWGFKLDLKVPVALKGNDLNLYIESALGKVDEKKPGLGFEGELGETEFKLGVVFQEDQLNTALKFDREIFSGASLKGSVQLEDGYRFQSSELKVDGVALSFNKADWVLSGNLKADLKSEPAFSNSLSLENSTKKSFYLPWQSSEGIRLQKLIQMDSRQVQVVLFNSGRKSINLKGWSLKGENVLRRISKDLIAKPGGEAKVHIENLLVENCKELIVLNPRREVIDSWVVPSSGLTQKGAVRQKVGVNREIEISFANASFDELTADWRIEIPWGSNGNIFGDLKINHVVDVKEAVVGFRNHQLETTFSYVEGKAELTYYPKSKSEDFETEIGFELNRENELKTFFVADLTLGSIELESGVAVSLQNDTSEVELKQTVKW